MKRDELNAYKADVTIPVYGTIADAEVYLKEKVDAIIAEKDAEIAEQESEIAGLKEGAKNLILDNYLKDKEIKHHKYKRCVAMAYVEWLKQMSLCKYPESILYRRAVRRERKWKEFAEKFKEAK